MALLTSVQGGTRAGWKKPFEGSAKPWICHCFAKWEETGIVLPENPGYLSQCRWCDDGSRV